jgi:glucose-1-phosphate adenylyltransferase
MATHYNWFSAALTAGKVVIVGARDDATNATKKKMDGQQRFIALVMAGGKGSRLFPLTLERAKPAVPFGGRYRIIDFVLSNLANSGVRSIYVLTQYKSQSLAEHVQRTWGGRSSYDAFVTVVPAQMRMGESWYRGTADSVFQNLHLIEEYRADAVLVFGADHIYKMNIRQITDFHLQKGAIATIACLPIKKSEANQFGIVEVDEDWRVVGFQEKPDRDPVTIPGDPEHCLGSMGNYVFAPGPLIEELRSDAERESHHDFGRNILPAMVGSKKVFAYNFGLNRIRGVSDEVENAYWRDVGTIDAYYEANMDLKNVVPSLNLYNWDWPIVTANYPDPPAKLVFDEETRRGIALQSILSGGCIVAGGFVKDSVLGRNVFVDAGARVEASILFDNVYVGRGAHVSRAIIDKNVRVPEGDHIGHDLARDSLRHTVSEGGITVVQKAKDTLLTRARNF